MRTVATPPHWRADCGMSIGSAARAAPVTECLRAMVETAGLPAVTVDGRLTEDALENCVAGKFGLDGRGSGDRL
jgi:hypothetical protein